MFKLRILMFIFNELNYQFLKIRIIIIISLIEYVSQI